VTVRNFLASATCQCRPNAERGETQSFSVPSHPAGLRRDRTLTKIRPTDMDSIRALEARLEFKLAPEYTAFLSSFGVIVSGAAEVYGLGVPDNYYLNVGSAYADLSRDPADRPNAVPVLDAGDARWYVYDNKSQKLILWATPNGGIVDAFDTMLESVLLKQVFRLLERGSPGFNIFRPVREQCQQLARHRLQVIQIDGRRPDAGGTEAGLRPDRRLQAIARPCAAMPAKC
jgi:hypothetical protein